MTPDYYRTCDNCLADMRSEDSDEEEHHIESKTNRHSTPSKDSPRSDYQEQSRKFAEEQVPTSPMIFKPAPPPKPSRSPVPGSNQSPFNGQPQPPSDVFGGFGSTRPAFRTYTTPPRAVSAPQTSEEPRSMQDRPMERSPPAPPSTSTSQELSGMVRAHNAAADERSRSQGMSDPIVSSRATHPEAKAACVEAASKSKPMAVPVPMSDEEEDPPGGTFQQRLDAMKKKSAAVANKAATPQLRSSTAPRLDPTQLTPRVDPESCDEQYQDDNKRKRSIQEMHVKMRGTGTFEGVGERKQSESGQYSHNGGGQIHGKRAPVPSTFPSPSNSSAGSPTRMAAQQKASVPAATSTPVLRPGTPAASGSQHITVASQIFREKLEALNSKSIVPPPRARSVPDPPQSYSGPIVFGIPDEAEPFIFENPLQNSQSRNISPSQCNLSNTVAAAVAAPPPPPQPLPLPVSTVRQIPPPPAPAHVPVTFPVKASSAPVPPPIVVPPPPTVDPTTLPRWGSNAQALSPTPSPKRPLSNGFADRISQFNSANTSPASTKLSTPSKISPVRQKVVEKVPTPENNKSALCVQETRLVNPCVTENLVAHSAPSKQAVVKETKETNVHMKSSCQVSDTKSSQPRPPTSSLNYSTSSVVKKDVDSGSMESASSRTTIESKVSTSTVTYQYEYDVDDDDDEEPPGPPDHSPKNSSSSIQKMPKGFNEKDVRRKMEADGVSPDVIEEFLRHISVQCATSAGAGASMSRHTSPDRSSTAFPISGKVEVLPPPMTPPCQPDTGGVSVYATYSKMLSMRIPEGAVRQKMITDGFSPSDVEEYFAAVRRGDGSEHKRVTPRSSPPPPPPPPPAPGAPPSNPKGTLPTAPPGGTAVLKQRGPDPSDQSTNRTKENNEKNKKSTGGSTGGLFNSFRGLGSKNTQEELGKVKNEKPKILVKEIESGDEKVAPVSSMFASIRSGVALKKASTPESGRDDQKRVQSMAAKNPTSMHEMLLIALESRRTNSNMEKAETCSSVASPAEFDPNSD